MNRAARAVLTMVSTLDLPGLVFPGFGQQVGFAASIYQLDWRSLSDRGTGLVAVIASEPSLHLFAGNHT